MFSVSGDNQRIENRTRRTEVRQVAFVDEVGEHRLDEHAFLPRRERGDDLHHTHRIAWVNIQYRVNASFDQLIVQLFLRQAALEPDVRQLRHRAVDHVGGIAGGRYANIKPDGVAADESEHDDEHQRKSDAEDHRRRTARDRTQAGLADGQHRLQLIVPGLLWGVHLIGPSSYVR